MNSTYSTKDIYLTAFLIACGLPLESYTRTNGVTTFRIAERDELYALIQAYYADHGNVSALRYGNSIKNLKNLIHSNSTYTYDNSITNNIGAIQ